MVGNGLAKGLDVVWAPRVTQSAWLLKSNCETTCTILSTIVACNGPNEATDLGDEQVSACILEVQRDAIS